MEWLVAWLDGWYDGTISTTEDGMATLVLLSLYDGKTVSVYDGDED